MSMSIRQVINALMDAKDLDKECVIEVHRNIFDDENYDWCEVHIEKVVNCDWGSVVGGQKNEEGDKK